ncbi:urea ABC transporter substrate-binding protein [Romeria aff. gracilis LEGE 07310]|uniref:Urea ABC transporter substrate-binding protein n=1 Tax=Vasconcelosia minhoensis LEGE 07310 TaxID=915328 RepID=A0A8J7AWZ8_9CYAN|nr:urea ABC transporter substrate-binding protein [Romeria gracilis]MBE9077502.1 urea ABC transporter substrate-binding protein [Romeria aff. gracilis LEGE 07310]
MTNRIGRRKFLTYGAAAAGGSLLLKSCAAPNSSETSSEAETEAAPSAEEADSDEPIRVGLLHSLSGTMAFSETAVVDAEKMAIAEINQAGGVLGQQIVAILEDGASDWPTFAEKVERLIDEDKVAAVFGGWTTASRKAMLPIVESKQHLLWYPVQFEGQECSQNIFYAGAAPNQQIEPAVDWLFVNKGQQFFLVTSDDMFPQSADFITVNTLVREQLEAKGGEAVGETSLPLGSAEVAPIISQIKTALPEGGVIFNSLQGDSNVAFFKQLKGAGLGPDQYPVMSVSIAEEEVRVIGTEFLKGHYAAWNYFQTVETPENEKFVSAFKGRYGEGRFTNDPMESAYTMIYLWKQAVEQAGTTDIAAVRAAAYGQTFAAPEGNVTMNPNHHLSKTARIGQVRDDGLFDIVWSTDAPVEPQPWSKYVPENKGFACDWSDPEKGRRFKA